MWLLCKHLALWHADSLGCLKHCGAFALLQARKDVLIKHGERCVENILLLCRYLALWHADNLGCLEHRKRPDQAPDHKLPCRLCPVKKSYIFLMCRSRNYEVFKKILMCRYLALWHADDLGCLEHRKRLAEECEDVETLVSIATEEVGGPPQS